MAPAGENIKIDGNKEKKGKEYTRSRVSEKRGKERNLFYSGGESFRNIRRKITYLLLIHRFPQLPYDILIVYFKD